MKKVVNNRYKSKESLLDEIIAGFDISEDDVIKQNRNTLKLFKLDDKVINVKSFRVPNILNRVVYKYIRKGKAQRSFEYANKLIELGIGTPEPIAYYEDTRGLLFGRSYYISEQLQCDLTYRDLIDDFNYPNYNVILRAFTRFTYDLHEKGIEFLDHSPGNTLIKKIGSAYHFYLVDLNRMKFGALDFNARIRNFYRLSKYKNMVEIMSDEYAKCIGEDYDKVFNLMWRGTQNFRAKFNRKKEFKKKLKL